MKSVHFIIFLLLAIVIGIALGSFLPQPNFKYTVPENYIQNPAPIPPLANETTKKLDEMSGRLNSIAKNLLEKDEEIKKISYVLLQVVEGISKIDKNGKYEEVNFQYANSLGYSQSELIGKSWEITVNPEDLDQVRHAYQTMVSKGEGSAFVFGIKKDGTKFNKFVKLIAIYNDAKEFQGNYCFMVVLK